MTQTGRTCALAMLAMLIVGVGAASVVADDTEHRRYEVRVDGKPAGTSQITMVVKDDGSIQVEAKADIEVKLGFGLIKVYSYSVRATEKWKNGLLVDMKCTAVEDGKKTNVEVTKTGDELRVVVNGSSESKVRGDIWPSSYWKLADAKFHNTKVPVLDSDTGREMMGDLQYVATEPIKIGGTAEDCYHFRITGIPVPIELWFDRYHRLVRQEFTESGHKTIVQLISVQRN